MKQLPLLIERLSAQLDVDAKIPDYANRSFRFELEQAFDLALLYEEACGNMQIRDYCSQMITRFKWIRERDNLHSCEYHLNSSKTMSGMWRSLSNDVLVYLG